MNDYMRQGLTISIPERQAESSRWELSETTLFMDNLEHWVPNSKSTNGVTGWALGFTKHFLITKNFKIYVDWNAEVILPRSLTVRRPYNDYTREAIVLTSGSVASDL